MNANSVAPNVLFGDIFPEYYLLCVDNFDKLSVTNHHDRL